MESDFQKFWQKEQKNFDLSKPMDASAIELIVLTVAYNAWTEAMKQSKKLIDEIITSENAHEFYKKNPDLA